MDQNHKGSVLRIAKVPPQINFKHSKSFSAFLVNFWPKNSILNLKMIACFQVQQLQLLGVLFGRKFLQEKSLNLSGK